MTICCCRKLFLFVRRYTAKNYWPSKIYAQDIIRQDYWSRYHRSLVASRSWRHSACMDTYTVLITACLVTSTLYANGTVTRQSLHVHQWCSCLDIYGTMVVINNTSSIVVTLRDWLHRKGLLAKVIFFYIWCCYSIVAYVHLRIRYIFNFYIHLQLHRLQFCCRPKCSAVGLVHCASSNARFAVGIVALHYEQCSSFVDDSATFIVSWCYPLLKLVKHYPSSTHCSWSMIITLHRAVIACFCIASWQCPRTFSDFAKHFNLNCIVVF